jgi:hypothetical protein
MAREVEGQRGRKSNYITACFICFADAKSTHSQFRDKIYLENPGVENIIASREDSLDRIIVTYSRIPI